MGKERIVRALFVSVELQISAACRWASSVIVLPIPDRDHGTKNRLTLGCQATCLLTPRSEHDQGNSHRRDKHQFRSRGQSHFQSLNNP